MCSKNQAVRGVFVAGNFLWAVFGLPVCIQMFDDEPDFGIAEVVS